MKSLFAFGSVASVASVLVCLASALPAQACESRLSTKSGPVCGRVLRDGSREFLGIPFAQPPVGALRWALPVPPKPWTSDRDAIEYGPGCMQLHHNPDVPEPQDEDCLSLNVYLPSDNKCSLPAQGLPAMVWFHGGSFEEGGSSLFFYNASVLAQRECVAVVAGNYRIGALGAVLLPGLPGNQNLHDQRAVLRWVHDNAEVLHVDRSRVTVFGQSAGAMSIGFHLTSPNSTGLFSRAIMQSNPAGYPYKSRAEGLEYGRMFMEALGCKNLDCMRSKNISEVLEGQKVVESRVAGIAEIVLRWRNLAVILPFTPTVTEDEDFPLQPLIAMADGKTMPVPLLVGSNEGDAILFVACSKANISVLEWDAGMSVAFGAHAHDVLKSYPRARSQADVPVVLNDVVTDFLFRCPSRRMAQTFATYSHPTYVYRFNHSLAFNVFNKSCCDHKPCHGVEIPLIFHATGPFHLDPVSEQLSRVMMSYWASFARSGDPNNPQDNTPHWPRYDAEQGLTMWLQESQHVSPSQGGVCDEVWDTWTPFWDKPH